MGNGDSRGSPDYKAPPVIEVACGISFETIEKFRGHHLGLFWQKIRDGFPVVEHASRLDITPEDLVDMAKYFPRIWFISEEQNRLIQLQDDKFFFNWRRTQEEEPYPRYRAIMEAFQTNLRIYESFLEEEDLGPIRPKACELTYINHIPKGEGWESFSDLNSIFRDLTWDSGKRFLPPPKGLGGQAIFALPDGKGDLNILLQQGSRKADNHPMLILRISARGLGDDKSMDAAWEWFDVAHEWIVCGFTDLTVPTIQNDIWHRTDTI